MNLTKSIVDFEPQEHIYSINGKKLRGVTSILSEYLFPDKYANIPTHILNNAKERGSAIHKEVEMWVNGFPFADNSAETTAFITNCETNNIRFIESEFLISDNETVASSIDIIDSDLNLYDIKTTSKFDEEYLSWQLSIYAYLFELQTKQKAKKLFGVWLRDARCVVKEIKRIDDDVIKGLLQAVANGTQWNNPISQKNDSNSLELLQSDELSQLCEIEAEIASFERKLKELKEVEDTFKKRMLKLMTDNGIKKWESDRLTISVRASSVRESFDSKQFKEDNPELYGQYIKTSNVSASLTIKVKDL